MKKSFLLAAAVTAIFAQAADKTQTGTIISENSVTCGSKLEKKQTVELLAMEPVTFGRPTNGFGTVESHRS